MRTRLAVMLFLLLTSFLTLALKPTAIFGSSIISVPVDFPSIQIAIDNAVDGDTVFVHEGIYGENVVVNKAIALVGENSNTTFIDGRNIAPTITVTAHNASVTGFTIENGGSTASGAGILVSSVQYVNVSHNVIISSYSGVSLLNSSLNVVENNFVSTCDSGLLLNISVGNLVSENTFVNTTSSCVYIRNSPDNQFFGNALLGDQVGAHFASSANSRFENNTVTGNSEYGVRVESSPNCVIEWNSLNQNSADGLSVSSSAGCRISENNIAGNAAGIFVQNSANVSSTGNTIRENRENGIYISNSQSNIVQSNNVSKNNGNGLSFQFANFSIASSNYVGNNVQNGVYFYTCANVRIVSNVIEYNSGGLLLQSCPNSTLSENAVRGNTGQGLSATNCAKSTVSGNVASNNGGEGIVLTNSENSIIEENIAYNNSRFGIWVQNSTSVTVLRCNVSMNGRGVGLLWDGIYLGNSNNSQILNNLMEDNGDAGSRMFYTDNVTLVGNNLCHNGDGLRIFSSNNNTINANNISLSTGYGINLLGSAGSLIYNNVFLNNENSVLNQDSVNKWDNGYPEGGNYWSDYSGTDTQWGPSQNEAGRDDIGDQHYEIDQNNTDHYPLVSQSRFHDLTFTNVGSMPDEVYPGWVLQTELTITNTGGYVETFNLTSYHGGQLVETHIINNLTVGASGHLTLTWNTSSLQPCSTLGVMLRISRDQTGVLAGNNTYNLGRMKVKILGDVNADGRVDVFDLRMIDTAFGNKSPETLHRLSNDMNDDGLINISDIALAAKNFGNTCP